MSKIENLVLYRKYRPKTFAEIAGQAHIVQTLQNALKMGKVAHAYLFTGPRGTGKTTIARLLAKAVNCFNQGLSEPCNKCESCIEINEGKALDLIEIDAASNRGIDEIRELREGIKFSPIKLKYKFFIMDECHMLTKEAFNALLKTLEEPPGHAIFILATTEAHKVPQTIISRCQRFDFHKLTLDKIIRRLGQISEQEKIKIDKSALELIAMNAEGAMRDAESLLGQIMSMGSINEDRQITLEEVQTILGTTDIGAVIKLVDYLVKRDPAAAVSFINKITEDGYDLEQFTKSIISYLRKMMVLKVDPVLTKMVASELTEEQIKIILNQGAQFSINDLIKMIKLFIGAGQEIKSATFAQLPLELVVVEILSEGQKY